MVTELHRIGYDLIFGYRSNIAASILRQAGFSCAKSLAGGIFAWSNAGYQLVAA
jgi:rhodanese-related sulfurtransferase